MNKQSKVPILSKQKLEQIAKAHTQAFSHFDGKDEPEFSVWKFAVSYLGMEVRYEWLSNCIYMLGMSVFTDNHPVPIYNPDTKKVSIKRFGKDTILLDKSLDTVPLYPVSKSRFTLMHECAHQILHQDYNRLKETAGEGGPVAYSLLDSAAESWTNMNPQKEWTDIEWMEWQANYLAAALLMPKHRIDQFLKESDILSEYQDSVKAKQFEERAYRRFVKQLADAFKVSDTTAKIRMANIGFKRLSDLSERMISPYDDEAKEGQKRSQTLDSLNEDTLLDWEDKYLDPEYIFHAGINKNVNKRQRRTVRAENKTAKENPLSLV